MVYYSEMPGDVFAKICKLYDIYDMAKLMADPCEMYLQVVTEKGPKFVKGKQSMAFNEKLWHKTLTGCQKVQGQQQKIIVWFICERGKI